MTAPGWQPDPTGRYELRYHNGTSWTADVATNGRRSVDPGGALPPPPPSGPPVPPPWSAPPRRTSGASVAALVCGIVATAGGWMPFVAVLTLAAAVVAVALGVRGRRAARRDGRSDGFAVAGIVLGLVGLAVSALGLVITVVAYRAVQAFEDPAAHDVRISSCERDGTSAVVRAAGTITNLSDDTATFAVYVDLRLGGSPAETAHAVVDDVAAGETATFTVRDDVDVDAGDEAVPACDVVAVHGPLPFGVDPGPS